MYCNSTKRTETWTKKKNCARVYKIYYYLYRRRYTARRRLSGAFPCDAYSKAN